LGVFPAATTEFDPALRVDEALRMGDLERARTLYRWFMPLC